MEYPPRVEVIAPGDVQDRSIAGGCLEWLRPDPRVTVEEVQALARRYGPCLYVRRHLQADEYVRDRRWREQPDRRGEVVFAIRQPNGGILLHTKHQYQQEIYRLPTGGIGHGESVEEALYREVAEETGQHVLLHRFVSLLDCRFHIDGSSVSFFSYVFYLESTTEELGGTDTREIAGYRVVPVEELKEVSASLRSLNGARDCWGRWRAISHDLIYQYLS